VRFEHLNIDAEAYVGNRGIPTFTNFFSNKIMVSSSFKLRSRGKKFYLASSASYPSGLFLSQDVLSVMHIIPSGKKPISILHNVSGIIKPGK
jgi:hypothetical protein